MKIAVISDIHSNIYALNEVLADIKNKKETYLKNSLLLSIEKQ